MRISFCLLLLLTGLLALVLSVDTWGQDNPPEPTLVLDSPSFWRVHHTVSTPEAEVDGAIVRMERPWTIWERSNVAEGWMNPDFDDRGWPRMMLRMTAADEGLAQLCARGKFEVSDPTRVKGLKLSVIYLNGQELTRAHLEKGANVAESYPEEVFADENGKLTRYETYQAFVTRRRDKLQEMKRRTIDIDIPSERLRKGTNVLAVEVIRSPYSKTVHEYVANGNDKKYRWATCMLIDVELKAVGPEGLVPSARRPKGFQVWNQSLLASDLVVDWGDRTEPILPVLIVGVRNGSFSGKLMVGSDREIQGISFTVADLKGPQGVIPASQVRVRYAIPWGTTSSSSIGPTRTASPEPHGSGCTWTSRLRPLR